MTAGVASVQGAKPVNKDPIKRTLVGGGGEEQRQPSGGRTGQILREVQRGGASGKDHTPGTRT